MRSQFVTVLNNFLSGSTSLIDLQTWLLERLQAISDSSDIVAIEAANEIDADLIALGEQLIDEHSFVEKLQNLRDKLQTITVEYSDKKESTVSALISNAAVVSLGFKAQSGQTDFHFHRIVEFSEADR